MVTVCDSCSVNIKFSGCALICQDLKFIFCSKECKTRFTEEAYRIIKSNNQEIKHPLSILKICNYCKSEKYTKDSMKKCANCNYCYYCDISCQKKDWKIHKTLCG